MLGINCAKRRNARLALALGLFSQCPRLATAAIQLAANAGVSGTVAPGAALTINADFTNATTPNLVLHTVNGQDSDSQPLTGLISDDKKSMRVRLDPATKPGFYYLSLNDGPTVVPGAINVQPDSVKLDAVHPATQYRGSKDRFDFDLVGDNFSPDPANDDVWIAGQGSIIVSRGNREQCLKKTEAELPCLWIQDSHLMHVAGYKPETHQGPVMISARVGSVSSKDERQIILAQISEPGIVIASIVATAVLFWIVAIVVSSGLKGNRAGNRALNLLQSFILDPQTNSYSLSKFQLMMFSATFIFGYVYVFLSRWLVQWQFTLPDVPSTIAGLLGISAGTTVASAGLTSSRGAKGGGLQYPTGADLITSGGVVIPERFQFFVWTIVACGGFVALLIGQDPAKVNDFPTIPQGLLYIMGVSAAGYLGGKATRSPGPVIQDLSVDFPDNLTVLIVQGQNLSSEGSFYIDGVELPIVPESQREPNAPKNLLKATPQTGSSDAHFSAELRITILKFSDVNLTTGEHRFRIVNKDGQFAEVPFTADRPRIMSVIPDEGAAPDMSSASKVIRTDTAVTPVLVMGKGLKPGSQVTWRNPATAEPVVLKVTPGTPADSVLRTSLVPGSAGSGCLTVTTPTGFAATTMVDVVATMPAATMPAAASSGKPEPVTAPAPAATASNASPAPGPMAEGQPGAEAPAAGPSPDTENPDAGKS